MGTYNGSAVGALISRVVISKVNEKTIKIELQTPIVGVYYSYVTVVNGSLANSTTVNINEDGTIASFPDTYRFSGNGTRNGNGLTINAQAQSKTNASDIKYFIFSGSK